jgi:hypothetical protein
MLSYIDCAGMSELTADEIAAVARHMQVPEIIAVEIGANLCRTARGRDLIERLAPRTSEQAGTNNLEAHRPSILVPSPPAIRARHRDR